MPKTISIITDIFSLVRIHLFAFENSNELGLSVVFLDLNLVYSMDIVLPEPLSNRVHNWLVAIQTLIVEN